MLKVGFGVLCYDDLARDEIVRVGLTKVKVVGYPEELAIRNQRHHILAHEIYIEQEALHMKSSIERLQMSRMPMNRGILHSSSHM